MNGEYLVVLTTCPDTASAELLATRLVQTNLAACVNIQGPVRSIFIWKGDVEKAEEQLLFIKTAASRYAELEAAIKAMHPYELPEIIAVPLVAGSDEYLSWIDSLTCKQ